MLAENMALSQSNPTRGYGSLWVPQQNQPSHFSGPRRDWYLLHRKVTVLLVNVNLFAYVIIPALINLFLQSVLGIHFCPGFVIASKLDSL